MGCATRVPSSPTYRTRRPLGSSRASLWLPSQKGCERESPPHGSNYDCFVDAIDRTGSVPRVDPDPMGFT